MRSLAAALLLLVASAPLCAQGNTGWLGTWTTANRPLEGDAVAKLQLGTNALTVRQIVHISQGGKRVRIRFSNEFGTTPLQIGAAHLAFLSTGSKILPATDKILYFSGQPSVTIPPGGVAASDPVVETVPIFSDLVISIALPAQSIPSATYHADAHTTTFLAGGDQTSALLLASPLVSPPGLTTPDLDAPLSGSPGDDTILRSNHPSPSNTGRGTDPTPGMVLQTSSWYFLKDVEVNAEKNPLPSSASVIRLQTAVVPAQKPIAAGPTFSLPFSRQTPTPSTSRS